VIRASPSRLYGNQRKKAKKEEQPGPSQRGFKEIEDPRILSINPETNDEEMQGAPPTLTRSPSSFFPQK
jgi:hypothetical protein